MDSQLTKLCSEYHALKEKKEQIQSDLEKINQEISEKNKELLDYWKNEGLSNVKFDGLGTFYLNKDVRASVTDQDSLFEYLRDNDHGNIIKETVNAKTLSAWAKESGMSNEALDNIGVKVYEDYQIRIRK